MEGHSFIVLLDLKLFYFLIFLNKVLPFQFLIVLIKLFLHERFIQVEWYFLNHDTEIGSSDGVVIDHAFVFDLKVVDDQKGDHPGEDDGDEEPVLDDHHGGKGGV